MAMFLLSYLPRAPRNGLLDEHSSEPRKTYISNPIKIDPHQQAALAAELAASELLMRQFLGGGSVQKNHNYLMEEQQRSAFVPSSPTDMQHRSRKSKALVSAQHSLPPPPTTHVIYPSAMPSMPVDTGYHTHHHHHQYAHHHGYMRSEPRRRQTSDSSSSSSSSLTPSPTSSTFDANESPSPMPYYQPQYGSDVGGHRMTAKGVNLKGRAMALFRGH
ncbi:hypothetical protein DFJ43DRAFT_1066092 [Lentinula guzmanii]|uniref:Uncharacterized protein n=1 Tax=Lentinula guzmanii TaxID=2804957 RepID=A0AA38JWD6_9AGAR|nr:hypothetical protein DFJ43DRAFT_1066092 [Lentinula guzmanii]